RRPAVRLVDEPDPSVAEPQLVADFLRRHDRPVEIRLLKRVSEAQPEVVEDVAARIKRHRTTGRLGYRPKLVDAVAMIAVGVGDDHAVERADASSKQLLAQVGTAIDQDAFAGAFDQDRRAQALIPGLAGITLA